MPHNNQKPKADRENDLTQALIHPLDYEVTGSNYIVI